MTYSIKSRHQVLVNTDPQRRCYYGCHARCELQWTPWEVLESNISETTIEKRLGFWRDLNDYAISQRGESARREFKALEDIPEVIEQGNYASPPTQL